MQYEDIVFHVSDHIAIITVNRPEVLNALRTKTKQELSDAFDEASKDENVRGVLLSGTGRAFISGSDISEIGIERPGEETARMSAHMHGILDKLAALPKPTMAVINGFALGGGLELALACDFRVCSDNAKMGLPEIDLGVLPCYGGTQRLPRAIGVGLAKEMLMTGRMLSAEEALRFGLVSRIFALEALMQDAKAWMETICTYSPAALRYAKICVDEGLELSLQDGLALESKVAGVLVKTPEAKKNVTAFLKKRADKLAAKTAQEKE